VQVSGVERFGSFFILNDPALAPARRPIWRSQDFTAHIGPTAVGALSALPPSPRALSVFSEGMRPPPTAAVASIEALIEVDVVARWPSEDEPHVITATRRADPHDTGGGN
jgi:hypothetical protein